MAAPTIVVVNDDPIFLRVAELLLTDEGYQVTSWPGGTGAYVVIRQVRPALVIIDIRLEAPDSGWKLVEVLRLDPATVPLPIIVCSADSPFLEANADRLRAHRCEVLAKPFDLEELLTTVRALIGPPTADP